MEERKQQGNRRRLLTFNGKTYQGIDEVPAGQMARICCRRFCRGTLPSFSSMSARPLATIMTASLIRYGGGDK
jgi:hypothetical protein